MVHTNATCELGRKGKGAMDPAVGLEHTSGDAVNDAVNGVAEVLLGHPNQAAADQDCHGDPVVQLEDHIVDGELVSLEDPFGGAQQVQRHILLDHTLSLQPHCH